MNLVTRPRPVLAAGAAAAAVALSLGACSVSVSSPGGGDDPPQTAQSTQAAQPDTAGAGNAESSEDGSADPSETDGPRQGAQASEPAESADSGDQETPDAAQQDGDPGATPGAQEAASAGGSGEGSADRPGASVTMTDSDWLFEEESVDKTTSCDNGPLLIGQSNEGVRVEGDCTTLTVTGGNAVAIAKYADTVVVNGSNIKVYIRDVKEVVISGSNNTVVWAGSTPTVKDTGTNTEARPVEND